MSCLHICIYIYIDDICRVYTLYVYMYMYVYVYVYIYTRKAMDMYPHRSKHMYTSQRHAQEEHGPHFQSVGQIIVVFHRKAKPSY